MRKMLLLIIVVLSLLCMSARSNNDDKKNDCDGYYAMKSYKIFWPLIGLKEYVKESPILDFQSAKGKATMYFIYSPTLHDFYVKSLGNNVYEIQSVHNKMKLYAYIDYDSEWTHTYYMSFFEKYDGKTIPDKRIGGTVYSPSQWKEYGWDDLEVMKERIRHDYDNADQTVTPID